MVVADAMAEAFRVEGIQKVFGLMGDANFLWLANMAQRPHVVVNARHELAAVAMADGYSRASGSVGVASVTCGPGLTHAATSICAAGRNRTPLIVHCGYAPGPHPGR